MVQEYVEKIMRNGISNFATEAEKTLTEVQILILWDAADEKVKYKKMVFGKENEEITFNQILKVKFDMMNREGICGNFISKTLDKYADELSVPKSHLFVVVLLTNNNMEDADLQLQLYNGGQSVKEIKLEEILA